MKKLIFRLMFVLPALLLGWSVSTFAATTAAVAVASDDGEDGDDGEDPEPYVEPAFTVYFNIDRPEAVYFTVNDQPVQLAEDNSLTVDPGDGYIKVHVADGYAFTKFVDVDNDNADYLQYDQQVIPVTIRKTISGGMEEADVTVVDGHHFTIETFDMSSLTSYTLTVDVDDASKVDMCIGPNTDIRSAANRKIALQNGLNTVTFTEQDKYLNVGPADFREPLYSATCDGKKMISDGADPPTYSMQLKGSKSEGSQVVIVANAPVVEDSYHFTANIDDATLIYNVKRQPANKNVAFAEGENSWGFNEGDTYEVWCSEEPKHITFNDVDLEGELSFGVYIYTFTPTDGGVLNVTFKEAIPGFNFFVDDASGIDYLMCDDTDEEYTLVNGNNFIPLTEDGLSFSFELVSGGKAFSALCDGDDIKYRRGVYSFEPSNGTNVVVYITEPQPDLKYIVMVSFANEGTEDVVTAAQINDVDVALSDLIQGIEVDAGAELWLSYSTSKYTINDITVNGVSKAPFNGSVLLNITEDTEIVFDVEAEQIEFNERFVMIIDGVESIEAYMVISEAGREIELYDFYNELYFNSEYDGAIFFGFDPYPAAVYCNGQAMDMIDEPFYGFEPKDGDIVRVYMIEVPSVYNVTFDVEEKVANGFTIYRDLMQPVDHHSGSSSELHGTYYVVVPNDGVKLTVKLFADNDANEMLRENAEGINIEEEDGMHLFQLDGHKRVQIKEYVDPASVTILGSDNISHDVYNMQGIKVKSNATDLNNLPAGMYIIGGKKVVVK